MSIRILTLFLALAVAFSCASSEGNSGEEGGSGAPAAGWVDVSFSISPDGTVSNVVILRSSDAKFEASARRTVADFRYEPKLENGVAVWQHDQKIRLRYELEEPPAAGESRP